MEALYRKYRPTTFSDVVGQEHIERTLKNAIEQNKVSHAYLFCGPRGTGKTTMARILAKALLCEKGPTTEPDGTCPECIAIANGTHPDVYELDAASRTGVDNVREEIISRVNYAPTRGAWKVYIIDEVHMLSTAAFNALLKTLEEPPSHVVFILCTTDPQKVPETIHSRCQRFDFHRISTEAIVSRLGAICVKEGVEFEGEALDLIAYRSDGGMRNALTSLEQLIAFGDGKATLEGAQNLLGSLDETDLSEIVLAIGRRDAAQCFNWVSHYVETGADFAQFVSDLADHFRNMYLLSMAGVEVEIHVSDAVRKNMVDQLQFFGSDRLARILMVLGDLAKDLRTSSNPRLSFEIALTRLIRPDSDYTIEALAERVEVLEQQLAELRESGAITMPSATAPQAAAVSISTAPMPASTPVATAPTAAPSVPTPVATAPTAAPSVPMTSTASPLAPIANTVTPAAPAQTSAATATASTAVTPAPATAPTVPAASVPTASAPTASAPTASAPTPAAAVTAPSVPVSNSALASLDLSNPAAVQRFWHSVTSSLRKANPARGVLFMNAKVEPDPMCNGIAISFAKDNGFAYNAAQKPEVQQLLAQTMQAIAGGNVAYRLLLEGVPGSRVSAAATASAAPAASAPSVQVASRLASTQQAQPVQPTQPVQPAQPVQPTRPVQQAQPSSVPAPLTSQAQASTTPIPDSVSVNKAAAAEKVRAAAEAAAARFRQATAQSVPPQVDQVPLDVYDSAIPADYYHDESAATILKPEAPAAVTSAVVTPAAAAPIAVTTPAAASPTTTAPAAAAPAITAPTAVTTPAASAAASPASMTSASFASAVGQHSGEIKSVDPTRGNEADQIKDILSETFGANIKFEELSD